jgi:predicted DNA-binding protein
MSLPTLGKSGKRSKAVALRLTEETAKQLKKLAEGHGLSQADVITLLVDREFKSFREEKKKS